MADLYRRCGCLVPGTKRTYPSLPSTPTEADKAAACPIMLKDTRHGSWGYSISGGRHPGTGKRIQVRRMGFATRDEANKKRAAKLLEIDSGDYRPDDKMTVGQYMTKWLESRIQDGLRPSTAFNYRRYVELDINPKIGAIKLSGLRKADVDKFLRGLRTDQRGAPTIKRIHAVLSSALTAAQRLDLITINPASKVALPRVEKPHMHVWSPDEVRTFLDAAATSRISPVFELALNTGMRRGELAGLKWEDINFTKRQLVVRQQRTQVGHDVVEGAIKTNAGQHRVISLGSDAIGALMAWQLQQDQERAEWGEAYEGDGWTFSYENGKPLRPEYISKTFDVIAARAKLPKIKFHDLRHTHASILAAAGTPLVIISKRLGHASVGITADLYTSMIDAANREAADAFESMIPAKGSEHKTSTNPA
ncbi:MAG: site-specific integrase [Frondihabitans sp.]|nr:site-specific integrase [Frondihabitans sp.]